MFTHKTGTKIIIISFFLKVLLCISNPKLFFRRKALTSDFFFFVQDCRLRTPIHLTCLQPHCKAYKEVLYLALYGPYGLVLTFFYYNINVPSTLMWWHGWQHLLKVITYLLEPPVHERPLTQFLLLGSTHFPVDTGILNI